MKLIVCRSCRDVVALDFDMRQCKCGKSEGRYLDNDLAAVAGDCFVIGIQNGLRYEMVERCEAFVIPDTAPTVVRFVEALG